MNTDRFKFRVWNNLINAYEDDGFLLDVRKGRVAGQNTDIYILEQCTGLRDKNGKLIFEGDMVERKLKDGTSMDKEVYYNSVLCRWYLRKSYPNLRTEPSYMFWDFTDSITKELEIIGNIHEKEGE